MSQTKTRETTQPAEKPFLERILLLAPLGRTAEVAHRTLEAAGLYCVTCADSADLAAALADGAGALLLLEEALTVATMQVLAHHLAAQPVWSDLPMVLFTREEPTQERYAAALARLGARRNVTLLRRPVPAGTLLSVMQSAMADRRRQVQMRDLLLSEQRAQQARQASQRQLQAAFETIEEGIVLQDAAGNVLMINPAGLRMNGLDPAQSIPQAFKTVRALQETHEVRTPDGELIPFEQWPAAKAQRFEPFTGYEVEIRERASGHRWIGRFTGQPVENGADSHTFFVTSMQDVTAQKETERDLQELTRSLEQRVQERTEQIRRLTLALTQAEQQERQRIAQFLHDDLQQMLYGVQIHMHLLSQDLAGAELSDLREQSEAMRDMLKTAIQRTRTLSIDLSPPVLQEENFAAALTWLAEQMQMLHNLDVDTSQVAPVHVADEGVRTLLFRSVRELLFNIAKHAGVAQARVALYQQDDRCWIRIEDDGAGFDVARVQAKERHSGGFGLHSVAERIQILGGQMQIDSAPGQGTRTSLNVPFESSPQ